MPCKRCGETFDAVFFCDMVGSYKVTLQLHYFCEPCCQKNRTEEAARTETARQQRMGEQRAARLARWKAICPIEFQLIGDGGATDVPRLLREQPAVAELLQWKYQKRGLLIRGATGRCKTRGIWRLLQNQFDEGKSIIVMTAVEFDRQCRDAGGNFTLEKWFKRLATIDILCIDDLGKGAWTPGTEAQFFDVFDNRTRNHRPVIFTTQETGETLKGKMSERGDAALWEAFLRRVSQYCDRITFT